MMNGTKILVYGAGPLGSLFAARLRQGGNDVSLLARGKRLSDLREYGIVLKDFYTKQETVTHVNIVERLLPEDVYDLVLVIMRKNHALEILPILAANQHTPNVLFLMNNAAGPEAFVHALGKERVLVGFPNSAGYFDGYKIHCIAGQVEDKAAVLFGEVDGSITERTKWVASVFESMPGYEAEIRTDMDAWHKTHVALLFPSIGPALYAAGTDNFRFSRTRDLLVLAIRAIREGFQVLHALDVPIIPGKMKIFELIPEPFLVLFLRRFITHPAMKIALVGHANAARNEAQHLADEFLVLARSTSIPTPAIDRLYPYFNPETPLMPERSKEIPLRWGGLVAWSVGFVSFIPLLIRLIKKKGDEAGGE
jgi:2-dehydropantoate 2-reductase